MAEQTQTRSDDEVPEAGSRGLLPPSRQRSPFGWAALALAIVALAAGGWWYQRSQVPAPTPEVQALPLPPQPEPVAAASAPAGAASVVSLPEPKVAEGPLDEAGVGAALAALAGPQATRSLLITDDFVRRFVVTIDNLGREHAPPRLWPVQPTPGRFQVIERDGRSYANPDNAARYTPWVLLTEQIDPSAAVALYGRMLPLLQQAYEELGYPGQRFHTRLMTVIDQLLATPAAPELIALTLVEVKGEVPSERPWVRYEFADPALQSASAGQKIMLRVGSVNQRRLKAQLRALRAELVRQAHP
ncbi:MAG TPA: DUF3014 domain-containing protein [Rubrivivax sp.]|nr:DUF3014 domain-containing protein [Rubrivivax sp.]